MTKLKLDTTVDLGKQISEKIVELSETVIFTPTPAQKKLKAKFWARYIPSPLSDPKQLTLSEAVQVTEDNKLSKLWAQPGFQSWFANRDENRERLEYLFTLALDTAEDLLLSETTQASAKVNMIKVLAELANKFPNKFQQEKFVDDEINRMSELQLKAWLERRGVSLAAAQQPKLIEVLDASYEPEEVKQETSHAEEGENPRQII